MPAIMLNFKCKATFAEDLIIMKIISWNVNGLRACMNKGFGKFLETSGADVFCIQETKMHPEQADFDFPDRTVYWNSALKKGYSGTAVASKAEPLSVLYDIRNPAHKGEGRAITLEFDGFYLVNVYTPNSQVNLIRLDYRMEWENAFRDYVKNLDAEKPVVICGDMNVAHTEIDLKNPKSNMGNPGFTAEERRKFTRLLDSGFIDTYRFFNPGKTGAYTWWSYRFRAREHDAGWRIDYFLVSKRFMPHVRESIIYKDIMGSDHCPVGIDIDI